MFNFVYPTRASWENLLNIISQPDCSLELLLKEPNVVNSIKYQVQEVCQYFFDNLEKLFDIAVSDADVSNNARGVLFLLPEQFPLEVSESCQFHNKINLLLNLNPIPKFAPVTISRMILALGKSENYTILSNLSENQFFFPKLCQQLDFYSVFESLAYLASDDHHAVSNFFEDLNASAILFDLLETSSPQAQERIFIILTELIASTDSESALIDSLKDEEHMQIMFEYATENPNNKVRAGAFKLIMCLCSKNLRSPSDSYDDSYDESNSDEVETQKNAFVDFYEIKIDKICEFISKPFSNNQVFESSNEQAIEVLLFFIKTIQISIEEIEEPLLKCLNYLFDKFFEGSWFTKLHASCYHLFMAICHDKETVQKCDLKNRILNYVNSHQHSVVDYGYVYKIANEIVSIEGEEDKQDESNKEARNEENSRTNEEVNEKVIEENWSKFVENELKEYNQKIEADYGGEKPKVDSYDSTYSDNNLNAIDEMIKKFDDEEVKISSSSSNSDDIIKKSPVQKWSDEDEQIDKELRLTELDFDFVISKPNTDPGSPWAKEIVDEMENNEDDFFIPRKEKTDNQINWANKALKELQEEELKGDQFDLDNIPDPED